MFDIKLYRVNITLRNAVGALLIHRQCREFSYLRQWRKTFLSKLILMLMNVCSMFTEWRPIVYYAIILFKLRYGKRCLAINKFAP